ncbi:hypothetical protein BDB01DRAFT_789189 [Pilobolus umbonatus]|nr:hypothetical protein BDB01DRAFT_789189 [Pilobolus umbonatus]
MFYFPNELLMLVIDFTEREYLSTYLFVSRFTFNLVHQRVYNKVIFSDNQGITEDDVISFCELYGPSLETIKLPSSITFSDDACLLLLQLCPKLNFLQTNILPKQLKYILNFMHPFMSFMVTHIPSEQINAEYIDAFEAPFQSTNFFPCCTSFFTFPSEIIPEKGSITQINHYYHHPGALRNAILPTFGSDLLSLTLNPFDLLTASVATSIVSKCPRLRYLAVPSVKAEGLWVLLRWCHTLATIIVGEDEDYEESDDDTVAHPRLLRYRNHRRLTMDMDNEKAIETIRNHKRVWCIHSNTDHSTSDEYANTIWHIGILPRK